MDENKTKLQEENQDKTQTQNPNKDNTIPENIEILKAAASKWKKFSIILMILFFIEPVIFGVILGVVVQKERKSFISELSSHISKILCAKDLNEAKKYAAELSESIPDNENTNSEK